MAVRPFYEIGIVRVRIVYDITRQKYVVCQATLGRYDDATDINEDFVVDTRCLKVADTQQVANEFFATFSPPGTELLKTAEELFYLDNQKQEAYLYHLSSYNAKQRGWSLNERYSEYKKEGK